MLHVRVAVAAVVVAAVVVAAAAQVVVVVVVVVVFIELSVFVTRFQFVSKSRTPNRVAFGKVSLIVWGRCQREAWQEMWAAAVLDCC